MLLLPQPLMLLLLLLLPGMVTRPWTRSGFGCTHADAVHVLLLLLLLPGMVTRSTWTRRWTRSGALAARATHPRRCAPH
jgi:hypothetical protein